MEDGPPERMIPSGFRFRIAASGIVAAATYAAFGTPWHVAAGAFAGIAAAYLAAPGPR